MDKRIVKGFFVSLALLALLASGPAAAEQVTVLRAERLLDVATGQLISNAVVVVEGDRIQAVQPAEVPEGAEVIELGDMTLLPGLIDMHTHLTGDLDKESFVRPVREGPIDKALRGAGNARTTLLAGFTTVRDIGAGGFADVALMRAIDRGLLEGPHIVPVGNALGITGGHCDLTGFAPGILEGGPEQGIADGPDEILKAVRYQIKHGAQVIKTCATAGVLSFEGPVGAQQYSEEELRVMVEEARRHGIKVAAHAHGTEGIIPAVRAGVASIEHGSMLNDEAIQFRAKAEYLMPLARESVRQAVRAGVKIAFGTDAAVFPHGQNAKEFGALVERGMTPLQAIQAATLNAVDLLGVDDRGLLEAGRLADIIAVPGNPLEDVGVLEDVRFVMKGGRIHKQP
jgi:imidazolonepropionase-like amidohydrolase